MQHSGPSSQNASDNQPVLKHNVATRFIGGLFGALEEQIGFYGWEVGAKRAMREQLTTVDFLIKQFKTHGVIPGIADLYKHGFGWSIAKKGPLRIYKYSIQDYFAENLNKDYGAITDAYFGNYGHCVTSSLAGVGAGILEPILFQWFDTMLTRKQTLGHPITFENAKNLGVQGLWRSGLVSGLGRNSFGAGALFGVSECANEMMGNYDHEKHEPKDKLKNLFAKWLGGLFSVVLSQPGDVIATLMKTEQITFREALKRTTLKSLVSSGFGARLTLSFKIGVGFLFVEENMNFAKKLFGTKVYPKAIEDSSSMVTFIASPETTKYTNAVDETLFVEQKTFTSKYDSMEVEKLNATNDAAMDELEEDMRSKMKIE